MENLILFDEFLHEDAVEILAKMGKVKKVDKSDPEGIKKEIVGATALVARMPSTRITREILQAAKNLKVIGRPAGSVDTVDLGAATEKGVVVVNLPKGSNSRAVSEFTFALILALSKRIADLDKNLKKGNWNLRQRIKGHALYGKTIGIIGFGPIGRNVAQLAKAFDMNVAVYRRRKDREAQSEVEKMGAKVVSLSTLLKESDLVSLHVPITSETKHLIGKEEISLMKNSSFLVNTGRGGVVDEEALYDALKEGKLAGAALDVFEMEPPDPRNPLLELENVILTPHFAGVTYATFRESHVSIAEGVSAVLKGSKAPFVANKEVYG